MTPELEAEFRKHVDFGFGHLRAHMLDIAIASLDSALQIQPENGVALRLAGVTRFKRGETARGLELLSEAIRVSPGDPYNWRDLAAALQRDGQAKPAELAYARAVKVATQRGQAAPPPFVNLPFSSEEGEHHFKMLDYDYTATIRHGSGRPSHPQLAAILDAGRAEYETFLDGLAEIQADFATIPLQGSYGDREPFWLNNWFPSLDGIALTGMLRRHRPATFLEIGSGTSTKFARRAVRAYDLPTRIVSIDPQPRAEVDHLCDEVIRQPLEACDLSLFEALEPGDILFLDSSHRSFQGSDVTVFFTEILPRVKPGVILHVHDIYLPDDYLSVHLALLWNEQYLLATALLFGGKTFEVLFPCWYAIQDPALRARAREAICHGALADLDLSGASFWMRKRA